MTIEKISNLSSVLRKEFKKVERKEWNSFQYLTELFVQLGHLSDISLRQEYKLNNKNEEENKKIIGDEIGDVILNVISICESEKIALNLDDIQDNLDLKPNETESILGSLFSKAGQLAENLEKNSEKLKTLSIETINLCYELASFYGIDMDRAFEDLYHESLVFIAKNYLPERKGSAREENFSEEIQEVTLDESLIEHFLEKPKQIEVDEAGFPLPFLLIRPSALSDLDKIRNFLFANDITVSSEAKINDFEELARNLYPVNPHDSNSYMWFILTRAVFPQEYNSGYVFFLDEKYLNDYQFIYELKTAIKNMIEMPRYKTFFQGQEIETNLHHIHAADSVNLNYECGLIKNFIEK